ncbi:MAG: Phenylacetic acid degradation operon negative regulatory protein [Candidatus Yanofskybacteria bacterium GW2011_GWA2_41_22]|uniref:Transcriptional repressor PaaX-like central Cas2-like domain-containing protein n=3 Tax=Candidatus Yanofskyibacteriota TaxID=1752733 RepID=A0A1F8HX21_9BACT|nr:MAG: Phenylacetic acid degradation operon negative regulatory protein [Candidatus Yanofskybacteria bacterium GW2011_GWA2_41_22]KKS26305.1 MAG: Phenylacetic acid degradation operon negative regulatory protein [Candidatus Yanofskybacteria bacterium GW2011_GWC2_41_9]OGN41580.1 MAG: hypothetical protein A2606_00120 [Candidatus Yanofskybacteria bacterium RIFOXYD1_FULL_42_10]
MKKKFLSDFFNALACAAMDMGGLFSFDFYLHRGRNHNLFYPDEHKDYQKRFRKGLYNLEQQGYIISHNKTFKFTKIGKKWCGNNSYKYTPFRDERWDKKWRVVFFDIPEELHTKRDIFRYRLKNWGFYQLQKSILVMPFKCESDIAEICSQLQIDNYVDILIAESIGAEEEEIKKIFDL